MERKRVEFDFEQRQRLESEIVPACVEDPEYAASEILRLEIERDEARTKIEAALAVIQQAKERNNDFGYSNVATGLAAVEEALTGGREEECNCGRHGKLRVKLSGSAPPEDEEEALTGGRE